MPQPTLTRPDSTTASSWTLDLHGVDPVTGHRATWRIAPAGADHGPGWCRVEQVHGEITHPAVWMQARKAVTVVPEAEVFDLIRRIASR